MINETRKKRKIINRKKIISNKKLPRLSVFRSNKHIYAQIIDDQKGKTLVSASDKKIKKNKAKKELTKNIAAQTVGANLADEAKKAKITKVCFDRGAYKYHGRVKVLAEAARKGGLIF